MTPRKTASQISDLIISNIETRLSTTIPLLPKSFCRVLAKALGGVFVLLFNFGAWITLQMFAKTASNEDVTLNGVTVNPLRMWGELTPGGPVVQNLGVKAERTIQIDVLTIGADALTSGTRFVNPTTEMVYVLVGDVALGSATVTGIVRATIEGEDGNIDVGENLYFQNAPPSVEKEVEVLAAAAVLGVDPQTTEAFRKQVMDQWAARPQGGAYADYRGWALEVAGVENAYPYSGWSFETSYPSGGPGYVFVYIESSADPDGIPPDPGALLTAVEASIEQTVDGQATNRNINARVDARPITRTSINVNVLGLYSDEDTTEVKDAIEEALEEYFLDREPFILGLHMPPKKDVITTSSVGGAISFVANAMGAAFTECRIDAGGGDVLAYTLQEGEKAKLGTLSFT